VNEGATPAVVEDDDVSPDLDTIMTISTERDRCRGGYKADRSRTKFHGGFAKIVMAVSFGDARINEHPRLSTLAKDMNARSSACLSPLRPWML